MENTRHPVGSARGSSSDLPVNKTLSSGQQRNLTDREKAALERVANACSRCRVRKIKCSGTQPCSHCIRFGVECVFATLRLRGRKRKSVVDHDHASSRGTPSCVTSPAPNLGHRQTGRSPAGNSGESAITTDRDCLPTESNPLAVKRQREARAGIGVCQAETGAFQFYGASSNLALFQAIYDQIHSASRTTEGATGGYSGNAISAWGLDQFAFPPDQPEYAHHNEGSSCLPVYLDKDLGDSFISTFFCVSHPQFPILDRSEVQDMWASFWMLPAPQRNAHYNSWLTRKNICLMVLAIGAIMSAPMTDSDPGSGQNAQTLGQWASYLSSRAQLSGSSFEDASLKGVHLLVLKAIYSLEVMRPNDAYLYAGHAALNALALGMNRSQVADGNSPSLHRLRVTFWNIYAMEKMISLAHGRASCLNDAYIDVALPEDCPALNAPSDQNHDVISNMAFVRAMVALGRTSDHINRGNYFPKCHSAGPRESGAIPLEYEAALNDVVTRLPPFLDFFDPRMPVSPHSWQEVQRCHLGLSYYHILLLIYRPALVLVSKSERHRNDNKSRNEDIDLAPFQASIDKAMTAAKELISLTLDTYQNRAPQLRQDATIAYQVMGACLTLLFDLVRGPGKTAARDVKATFDVVQDAITCLDYMEHFGPRFGKMTMSSRIVKVAKDAFRSTISTDMIGNDENNTIASSCTNLGKSLADGEQVLPFAEDELTGLLDEFPWLSNSMTNTVTSIASETPDLPDQSGFQTTLSGMMSQNPPQNMVVHPAPTNEAQPTMETVSSEDPPMPIDIRTTVMETWIPSTPPGQLQAHTILITVAFHTLMGCHGVSYKNGMGYMQQ